MSTPTTTAAPPCRECGGQISTNFTRSTAERMLAEQLCFGCLHWTDLVRVAGLSKSARIDGRHYIIGPEGAPAVGRGFGGQRFVIRFHDGREVATTNLWSQGVIPDHFRARLADNAEFVR